MFRKTILKKKDQRYVARKRRTNAVAKNNLTLPRIVVTRSLVHISAQLIDPEGKVVVVATDKDLMGTKSEKAFQVGKHLAERALAAGVMSIVFDRNGYPYHGRVKQLAEGAREVGLFF